MTDWVRPLERRGRPGGPPPRRGGSRQKLDFERAVERFAEQYVSKKTGRPFSVTSRQNVLDNLLGAPLTAFRMQHGIRTVADWNGDHAAAYLRWLQQDLRRDSATILKVRGQLRSFDRFCEDAFHTTPSRAALAAFQISAEADFERPKDPPLTRSEADAVQRAAPAPRDRLVVAMLLFTGMRPSELVALEAAHVRLDPQPPVVHVAGRPLASGRSDDDARPRDVPLTIGQTVLPALLRAHLDDAQRPAAATRLFLSKRSDAFGAARPLTLEGLRAMLFDLGKETGIKCHAYRLRHTFCTWCADAGLPMAHLQQLLGLKHSDMLLPYYGERTPHGVIAAAARLRF